MTLLELVKCKLQAQRPSSVYDEFFASTVVNCRARLVFQVYIETEVHGWSSFWLIFNQHPINHVTEAIPHTSSSVDGRVIYGGCDMG